MDRSSRQKINKETPSLNDMLDINRTFQPQTGEHTFFKCTWNILQDILLAMLGHKTKLNKFKKIEIISNIFSDHNTVRLESTTRKNCRKKKPKTKQTCGG